MSLRFTGTTIIVALMITYALTGQHAEAAQTYQDRGIGIIIETACRISSSCIDYMDISILDNSNQLYAGKLVEQNGDLIRKCSSNQNNYKYLQFEKEYQIIIDPCLQFKNQLKTITIVSQLDEYQMPNQMKIIEAKSAPDRTATHDIRLASNTRYVDSTCTHATITAKNWNVVLVDTLNYMQNDCDPAYTEINTLTLEMLEKTQHKISDTYKYKLEKYYNDVKDNCLKTFLTCKPENNPNVPKTVAKPNHYIISLVE